MQQVFPSVVNNSQIQWVISTLVFLSLFLYANQCGLWFTHDSFFYLAAAKSFNETFLLKDMHGDQFLLWPPLYPILLSVDVSNPANSFVFVHALAILLGNLCWYWLFVKWVDHAFSQGIYALLLGTSTPIIVTGSFIWSEAVFYLLGSAYLLCYLTFVRTEKPLWLWLSILPGALLPLQRIAGIFVVIGVGLSTLVLLFPLFKRHLWHFLLHGLAIVFGFLSWFLSTQLPYENRVMGLELEILFVNVENFFFVFSRWVSPVQISSWFYLLPVIIIGFVLFRWALVSVVSRILGIVISTYTGFFIAIMTLTGNGELEDVERFLFFLFPMVFWIMMERIKVEIKLSMSFLRGMIVALLVGWMLYPLTRTFRNVYLLKERSCNAELRENSKSSVPPPLNFNSDDN